MEKNVNTAQMVEIVEFDMRPTTHSVCTHYFGCGL